MRYINFSESTSVSKPIKRVIIDTSKPSGKWITKASIGIGLAGLGLGATTIATKALNRRKRKRRPR